jgi:hypothetical protein
VKDFVLTHSNCCQANTQKLDELSGEFDPISDADSNYGRVLGLAHISRTNGVIPEDMDVSPEEKAPTQMLAMPDRFIRAKKIAQLTNTKNLYGTNAVSRMALLRPYCVSSSTPKPIISSEKIHHAERKGFMYTQ